MPITLVSGQSINVDVSLTPVVTPYVGPANLYGVVYFGAIYFRGKYVGGTPLSGVKVTLSEGWITVIDFTDDLGRYDFVALMTGRYSVTFEKEGYRGAQVMGLQLLAGDNEFDISL